MLVISVLTFLFSNRTLSPVSSEGKLLQNMFRLVPSALKSTFNFLQWSDLESHHVRLSDPRYHTLRCLTWLRKEFEAAFQASYIGTEKQTTSTLEKTLTLRTLVST